MNIKEKQAWRTIVAVLQETGYDRLYDEEIHSVAECLRRCEQQCKKQKEVIDRILNETKETRDILNNNRDDNILSKSCLLSYLEIVEDLLKEVSE